MGKERPVLGLVCCTRNLGEFTVQAVLERYIAAAVRFAQVDALLIPSMPAIQDITEPLRRLDGVLLTGSPSNVEPWRYGDSSAGNGPFDPGRDETVLALVRGAVDSAKPVFGICRGFEEINVAMGGPLRRDLGEARRELSHHAIGDCSFNDLFAHRHPVKLAPDGILARCYGTTEIIVNSVHYQGVEQLAPGLAVEARAPDGVIEAVRGLASPAPLLAVQWHPEDDADRNPLSARYFRLLGACMRGATLEQAVE